MAENAEPRRRKLRRARSGWACTASTARTTSRGALGEVAGRLAGENERLALARHRGADRASPADEYKPGRKLYTNVEYYSAVVLGGIDLPADLYPATLAAARTWLDGTSWSSSAQPPDPPDGRLRRADA